MIALKSCPRCQGDIIDGEYCLQCGWERTSAITYYPMLAKSAKQPFDDSSFIFEKKIDGIRAIAYITDNKVRLVNRSMVNITDRFPEVVSELEPYDDCVLDGEIEPVSHNFQDIQKRANRLWDVETASVKFPATYVPFDCLEYKKVVLCDLPLVRRKDKLFEIALNSVWYVREFGTSMYHEAIENNWEGIMAKIANSEYYSGRRSSAWLKIKVRKCEIVEVVGCTVGYGKRRGTFGSLILTKNGVYCGECGTGYTDDEAADLITMIRSNRVDLAPVKTNSSRSIRYYCRPIPIKVSYSEVTEDGMFRFPSFEGVC